MRVALYLRRSTNEELQADSLIVQEQALRRHALENGHDVIAVFADSASGRAADRSEFQKLLHVIRTGPSFEAVLVRDVSRWGRFENCDEAAFHEFLCLSRGVKIIYVEESFGPDDTPYASLMKAMKRVLAAEFSRDKSRMVRTSQARVVQLGFMHGGAAPYGLERVGVNTRTGERFPLPRGVRKILSTTRVTLEAGDPAEVSVVREIFRLYADDPAMDFTQIAKHLNETGVPAPGGPKWWTPTVRATLLNELYIGTISYRQRRHTHGIKDRLQGTDSEATYSTANAFPGIITQETWERVQEKLKRRSRLKSSLDLAQDLRQAFERWGHVEAEMLTTLTDPAHWATYRKRFRDGYFGALELAYASEVRACRDEVLEAFRSGFQVDEEAPDRWLLNSSATLTFRYSWPRSRSGSIVWEFPFRQEDDGDLVIGMGFGPPPDVQVLQKFVFRKRLFVRRRSVARRKLTATTRPDRFYEPRSDRDLVRYVGRFIYTDGSRTAQTLEQALCDLPVFNRSAVAAALGWPETAVRRTTHQLRTEGRIVAAQKYKPGRRITVVCPRCGKRRRLRPSDAFALTRATCRSCTATIKTTVKTTIFCPRCGRSRVVFPCQIKVMTEGRESLCHQCALAKGREQAMKVHAAQPQAKHFKRAALRGIAILVFQRMKTETELFKNPSLWSEYRVALPTLRWRGPASGASCRLTLDCGPGFVADSTLTTDPARCAGVVGGVLDRTRWESRIDKRGIHLFRATVR